MTRAAQSAGADSLPVLGTILSGYGAAARLIAPCTLLAAVASVLVVGVASAAEALLHLGRDARAHYTLAAALRYETQGLILVCLQTFAEAPLVVFVYRTVILGETLRWRSLGRIGRREMRVFAMTIILDFPLLILKRVTLLTINLGVAPLLLRQAFAAIGSLYLRLIASDVTSHLLYAALVAPFFSMVFPLAALDSGRGLLRQSVRLSRGHRTRLAMLAFLAPIPITALSYLPWYLAGTGSMSIRNLLLWVMGSALEFLNSAFTVAVIATAYRRISDHRHRGTVEVFD